MPTVLHITSAGNHWWRKQGRQAWLPVDGPDRAAPNAPVWVMTDLTEESVAEIAVPRVFGADRSRFVERQLANRYPETEFRIALAPTAKGSLLDRLAPPLQPLAGIEPGDKVKAAIQELDAPLAGVWSVSLLLARLGQRSSLPANLFVVHCQANAMRILYLKERAPALTRLVAVAPGAAEQAAEVVRTLRHLENTRVVERGNQRYAVLLLGGSEELALALARERMDCLPVPPAWGQLPDPQSNAALFDLVCKSPPGQMAPLRYRARYLANNLSRAAQLLAGASLLIALWLGADSIQAALKARSDRAQVDAALAGVQAQTAEVDKSIEAFGVSPDMVRKALAIDAHEISGAPDLPDDLKRLSRVVSAAPGLRLNELKWQVLDGNTKACGGESAAAADAADPAAPAPEGAATAPQRQVELQIGLKLPPDMGPRQATQHAEGISRALAALSGATVLRDPARQLRDGDIRIGSGATEGREMQWCVSLATPAVTAPMGGQP